MATSSPSLSSAMVEPRPALPTRQPSSQSSVDSAATVPCPEYSATERSQAQRQLRQVNKDIKLIQKGVTMLNNRIKYHWDKNLISAHQKLDLVETRNKEQNKLKQKLLEKERIEEITGTSGQSASIMDRLTRVFPTATTTSQPATVHGAAGLIAASTNVNFNIAGRIIHQAPSTTTENSTTTESAVLSYQNDDYGNDDEDGMAELRRQVQRAKLEADLAEARARTETAELALQTSRAEASARMARAGALVRQTSRIAVGGSEPSSLLMFEPIRTDNDPVCETEDQEG